MSNDVAQRTSRPVPRKLNQGMIDALSEYIRKGNYAVTACSLVGISEDCYYTWLELARKDEVDGFKPEESIYMRLHESLKKAEADAEDLMVQTARNAAVEKKDGYLAITVNERRHPERWGRKDRTRVDINEKRVITITHVEIVLNQGDGVPMIEGES